VADERDRFQIGEFAELVVYSSQQTGVARVIAMTGSVGLDSLQNFRVITQRFGGVSVNGEGRSISFRSPGSSRTGRLLMSSHAASWSSSKTNTDRSARIRRAASVPLASMNPVTDLLASAAARSNNAFSSDVARSSMRSSRLRFVVDVGMVSVYLDRVRTAIVREMSISGQTVWQIGS